jgi:hypothetical protein
MFDSVCMGLMLQFMIRPINIQPIRICTIVLIIVVTDFMSHPHVSAHKFVLSHNDPLLA